MSHKIAARDPEWRRQVAHDRSFEVGPGTDELGPAGVLLYPFYDPDDPEYWFGAHASRERSWRHARRLGKLFKKKVSIRLGNANE